jgi:hypothetical protein
LDGDDAVLVEPDVLRDVATIMGMSAAKPKTNVSPKPAPPQTKQPELAHGFPGTDQERSAAIRRLAEEHRETLRRLGK